MKRRQLTCEVSARSHRGAVSCVRFSPCGAYFASCSYDRTARVYDVETGDVLHILPAHTDWLWRVQFSKDGALLATASDDRTARVWDVRTGFLLNTIRSHVSEVSAVEFSPFHSRLLATASHDKTIALWLVSESNREPAHEPGRVREGESDAVKLCQVTAHTDWVIDLKWSPVHAETLLTLSRDRSLKLWRVRTGYESASCRLKWTLSGHTHELTCAVFSQNGQWVASGSKDRCVRLWDSSSGRSLAVAQNHRDQVRAVAFSRNGRRFASASKDWTVNVYEITGNNAVVNLQLKHTLRGHINRVDVVEFFPDDCDALLTCSHDGVVRTWNLSPQSSELVQNYSTAQCRHESWVGAACISKQGDVVVTASGDGTVQVWRRGDGSLRSECLLAIRRMLLCSQSDDTILARDSIDAANLLGLAQLARLGERVRKRASSRLSTYGSEVSAALLEANQDHREAVKLPS